MQLHSTNSPDQSVSLRTAVMKGLPEDNGLYMPNHIPQLDTSFWERFPEMSFTDLAYEICLTLFQGAIPETDLRHIIHEAVNFDAPLVSLQDDLSILELFHGPSLAFKDFGARFMAKLMAYFNQDETGDLHILVATSGDTGGAVAAGFLQTEGIKVIILYPSGKVSLLQEKQLTTLGHNITALEIDGTFDDCQALVKQAFLDQDVQNAFRLTSANSINIARLIPQMFYYFRAYQQVNDPTKPVVCCVPSGNFGNLTAGLLAKRMGLPISHFIAATNVNDVVPTYLQTSHYSPRPSKRTISNAMDVGKPSNFVRMQALYAYDWENIKQDITAYAFTDEETLAAIQSVFHQHGYILDPHTAVAYLASAAYQQQHRDTQIIALSTAHPSKFLDVVEPVIGQAVPVPDRLEVLRNREKVAVQMGKGFTEFKRYFLNNTHSEKLK